MYVRMPEATNFVIGSILRRAMHDCKKFNIITFCTHERYEQMLAKTGHNFFSLKLGKKWNTNYGNIPENYHQLNGLPDHIDYDMILCQDEGRYKNAREIANMYNIPLIMLKHVLPDVRFDVRKQVKNNERLVADHYVYISEYNMRQWGETRENVSVIHHGVDLDFWADYERERKSQIISVANLFPERDWCLGWNLWCDVLNIDQQDSTLPEGVVLVGDNPPYSEPAHSLQDLRKKYHESQVFFNTSLHSPVPTSLLEAMACGCAVVSTETCMIPDIIESGVNGFISNDMFNLRMAINTLLNDPELARSLGQKAQETIKEKFGVGRFCDEWNNVFYRTFTDYECVLL